MYKDLEDPSEFMQKVPLEMRIELYSKLFVGLEFMKSRKLVHMDIKPANLMLNLAPVKKNLAKLLIKFIDFGLTSKRGQNNNQGSPAYMHPDLLNQGDKRIYNQQKFDIWSLLLSIIEIETGEKPVVINEEAGETQSMIDPSSECLKNYTATCFAELLDKVFHHFKIQGKCQRKNYNEQQKLICVCL